MPILMRTVTITIKIKADAANFWDEITLPA